MSSSPRAHRALKDGRSLSSSSPVALCSASCSRIFSTSAATGGGCRKRWTAPSRVSNRGSILSWNWMERKKTTIRTNTAHKSNCRMTRHKIYLIKEFLILSPIQMLYQWLNQWVMMLLPLPAEGVAESSDDGGMDTHSTSTNMSDGWMDGPNGHGRERSRE